jgi:hypothetical protein
MPPQPSGPESHPPLPPTSAPPSPTWRTVVRVGLLGATALLVAVGLAIFVLFGCKTSGRG